MSQTLLELKLERVFNRIFDEANFNDEDLMNIKGNPEGLKGFPDRIVFADEIYWVEIKVGKEHGSYYKQTPTQKKWQLWIETSGGIYVLLEGRIMVERWANEVVRRVQKKIMKEK